MNICAKLPNTRLQKHLAVIDKLLFSKLSYCPLNFTRQGKIIFVSLGVSKNSASYQCVNIVVVVEKYSIPKQELKIQKIETVHRERCKKFEQYTHCDSFAFYFDVLDKVDMGIWK